MRKCSGRLSLRTLMWPYASSTPWSARMRLPATRSSISCRLAAGFFKSASSGRRRRSRHRRVVARQHSHIDDAHGTALYLADRLLQGGFEVSQLLHRPDADGALRARHHRDVDVGLVDALSDPLVLG